jgi:hypothetical protein
MLVTNYPLRTPAISLQGVFAPALSMLLPRSWQLSSDSLRQLRHKEDTTSVAEWICALPGDLIAA